jgi:hypothetical protein
MSVSGTLISGNDSFKRNNDIDINQYGTRIIKYAFSNDIWSNRQRKRQRRHKIIRDMNNGMIISSLKVNMIQFHWYEYHHICVHVRRQHQRGYHLPYDAVDDYDDGYGVGHAYDVIRVDEHEEIMMLMIVKRWV